MTLGTAGGPVPTVDRSEPANLLVAGEEKILVDTGDGTVGQLARLGMSLGPIRHVFISHHHHDHTGGLAAVVDPQRDVEQYLQDAREGGYTIKYVILTHFHADFLAGHIELRNRAGAQIVM